MTQSSVNNILSQWASLISSQNKTQSNNSTTSNTTSSNFPLPIAIKTAKIISSDLVSVQPLSLPSFNISYKDFIYGHDHIISNIEELLKRSDEK